MQPIKIPNDLIVHEARQHLAAACSSQSPLPSYGSRWQPQVEAMRRDIPALSDVQACLRYGQYHITFDGRPPFPGDKQIIQFREWAVSNEFPQYTAELLSMAENPLSGVESLGEFNGRVVSIVFYYHARNVLAGITYAAKPNHVIEIGGGYGEIARLWVNNPIAPAERYVIVDIPESLFFAEVALRAEFGDVVGYFGERDPKTPITLVPLTRLDRLRRSFDLVVNTGSMQEMTDEWIDFYMSWLSRCDARFFYCLNYAAQPISVMGESRNLWTQRPGSEWATRHVRLNIPLLDLAGPTRDYLETLYERAPATERFADWSVHQGRLLSKTTYVEGLELLRQDFTENNIRCFVDVVARNLPYRPKELLHLVRWLTDRGHVAYRLLRNELERELGGLLYHEPPPPDP
jgi:hypothetical protein